MAVEVYIWSILLILMMTAVAAKVLTSHLLVRLKKRVTELGSRKHVTNQRLQAVSKRLESLKNTREMMARRRDRLQDEITRPRV